MQIKSYKSANSAYMPIAVAYFSYIACNFESKVPLAVQTNRRMQYERTSVLPLAVSVTQQMAGGLFAAAATSLA